jgi:hypothetical protein
LAAGQTDISGSRRLLCFYQAGVDPLKEDRLGRLRLTRQVLDASRIGMHACAYSSKSVMRRVDNCTVWATHFSIDYPSTMPQTMGLYCYWNCVRCCCYWLTHRLTQRLTHRAIHPLTPPPPPPPPPPRWLLSCVIYTALSHTPLIHQALKVRNIHSSLTHSSHTPGS